MKNITRKCNRILLSLLLGGTVLSSSCSRDFLTPDPLSFFDPEATFNTKSGLEAALAICDRHLKLYWMTDHGEVLSLGTEYMFSELMVAAATDQLNMMADIATMLSPTSDDGNANNIGRTNSLWYFWDETYKGIMNANTILNYVDDVEELDEATKNRFKGQAYFHRSFRYLALVFQYGDVPLVTRLLDVPKRNYHSTEREAILQMITENMEFAVEWVPNQSEIGLIGMVNKGACRMLLSKCYLAMGEYEKAKEQLDILINQSGYSLLQGDQFGTFNDGGEPQTWPITRNVIWDMHRAENKLRADNRELIMGMPNRGASAESFVQMLTMRVLYPFVFDNRVQAKDGRQALLNIIRSNADYNPEYDYMRAFGRGIATFRPTRFQMTDLWRVNGVMDETDLRHSSEAGNWIRMEDYKVNNKASTEFGKPLVLRNPDNGALLCSDTIRRWFDVPHYKLYLDDPINEANPNSNGYQGATNGGNADWYLYRLAEAYLLRAEAKFYINPSDPTIKDDLNIIRQRAQCSELYTGTVTIGDIMNERARELYWEEWRNVELKRVSLCLARSGRPDEWGNTYNLENFDKQSGTDNAGGSYWYQRIVNYSMYNKGVITIDATGNNRPHYRMDKKNMYWPIPNAAITANRNGRLSQNYGYSGYDPSVPKWDNWQDAVADEETAE
ncbi:RagB/SusD family nutrient uptake outer membrane protein [Sphingobacterium pedocola]|uniref:RagB/SusD family nutrient uptake outer membrane protein n=1 Tax=Sphingobacterium pedocola TaxID=2082722 RepID=A0ABR9T810_9SPHI|nr:RagB/SusD family nutrient uptake outer membrane protein [Sphingobacterium pedocola]MBE8721476.1 RagB/SusD family nutrient uptake outer membrane protein [Sphingobacterium pedocola]